MTHRHTRAELEKAYGAFWFIKLPFKGMFVDKFYEWTNPAHFWNVHWRKMIEGINIIDTIVSILGLTNACVSLAL